MFEKTASHTLSASALSPERTTRFLAAMQAASDSISAREGEDELELRLRRLRPASVAPARELTWLAQMQAPAARRPAVPARGGASYRAGWAVFGRWSAAAAFFLLCTAGSFLMVTGGSASATAESGLACRSVVESRAGDSVQWQEGQTALRTCHVLYEDSFVLDGDEDSTITVRVPVRTRVMIEEEII